MVRTASFLHRLLCLGMAIAMLVPAAASSAHNLHHGLAVAAHHPDQASQAASDRSHTVPAPDRQDGGHDHQLSLSVPAAILLGETPLVHPPVAAQAPPESRVRRLLLRPAEPPPADPPRLS